MDTKNDTAVFRMKNHVNGGTYLERKPKQWVKVMGRLSDPKARKRIADLHLKDTGHKMSDPHTFHLYMGYPIESFGFKGAFDEAEAYIESQESIFAKKFEWKISGGEW